MHPSPCSFLFNQIATRYNSAQIHEQSILPLAVLWSLKEVCAISHCIEMSMPFMQGQRPALHTRSMCMNSSVVCCRQTWPSQLNVLHCDTHHMPFAIMLLFRVTIDQQLGSSMSKPAGSALHTRFSNQYGCIPSDICPGTTIIQSLTDHRLSQSSMCM